MILYYLEDNGDFLAVDRGTGHVCPNRKGFGFEARAAALRDQPSSICSTFVSQTYLDNNCKRVRKSEVPLKWLKAIGYEKPWQLPEEPFKPIRKGKPWQPPSASSTAPS